jgi:hypothetical protein
MPIVLDGSQGISTPMYAGSITSNPVTPSVNMKNRLINGNMVIDQRNAGAAQNSIASGSYMTDRWSYYGSQASKFNAQQNAGSVTTPAGFKNYLGMTTASAYSVGSGDYFFVSQQIEGYNIADLNWGTANAKAVTISFLAYSSLTGTFGGAIRNSTNNYSYPFSYSIPVANTWTTISISVAGPTAGTWNTTNTQGLSLSFSLGTGTTLSGTAGSWSANEYVSATGAVSVIGTLNATFYITGVQLEVGSTATSFDYRPYGTELALCQRYCWVWRSNDSAYSPFGIGRAISSTSLQVFCGIPMQLRATPTVSYSAGNTFGVANNNQCSVVGTGSPTRYGFNAEFTTTGLSTNGAYLVEASNTTSAFVIASSEL